MFNDDCGKKQGRHAKTLTSPLSSYLQVVTRLDQFCNLSIN